MKPPAPKRPTLSIADAWDEGNAFLRAELGLVAPVALAFLALPAALGNLLAPATDTVPDAALVVALGLLGLALQLFGWVAIALLALKPGLSVAEALRAALGRMPTSLGLAALLLGAAILLSIPIAPYLPTPDRPTPPSPSGGALLYMLVLSVGLLVLAARLALSNIVVAAEALGPIAAMRRSFALTRGVQWRLLGFLILFLLFGLMVQLATKAGLGSLLTMVGRLTEQVEAARVLSALVSATIGAALTAWLVVILARIYARLAGWSNGI